MSCAAIRALTDERSRTLTAGQRDDDRRERPCRRGRIRRSDRTADQPRRHARATDRPPCRSDPRARSRRAHPRSCRRRRRSPTWGTTARPTNRSARARLVAPPLVRSLVVYGNPPRPRSERHREVRLESVGPSRRGARGRCPRDAGSHQDRRAIGSTAARWCRRRPPLRWRSRRPRRRRSHDREEKAGQPAGTRHWPGTLGARARALSAGRVGPRGPQDRTSETLDASPRPTTIAPVIWPVVTAVPSSSSNRPAVIA